jgi:hypothetical protein
MDHLSASKGLNRFILFGLCSGADMAFEAAHADPRVVGLAVLDPWVYRTPRYFVQHYGPRLLVPSAWANFLRARLARGRTATPDGDAAGGAPEDLDLPTYVREFPPREASEERLRALVARGVQLCTIFSGGQSDHYNYRGQFRGAFRGVDFGAQLYVPWRLAEGDVLYRDIHQHLGPLSSYLNALLFAVFSAATRIEGFTANAELFTFLPLVLNAILVWERRWFWAGVATSIAFQIKPSGVEGCILVAICVIFGATSLRAAVAGAASSLAGFLAASVPMLVHAYLVGWDHFFFNLVTLRGMTYNQEYFSLDAQTTLLPRAVAFTFSSWAVPAVLSAIVFPQLDARRRRFVVAWLVGATAGMVIGFYWSWHFFLQLIPPLSVVGGYAWSALPRSRSRWVWAVALAATGAAFVVRDAAFLAMSPKEICWNLYHRPSYLAVEEAAAYVARTTRPEAVIYVAFGEPELYHLAGRRPAVQSQLFNGHARWVDFAWRDAIEAVKNRVPEVIVWAQPPPQHRMSSQEFSRLLGRGYRPEVQIGVIRIFRRSDASSPEQLPQ